MAKSKNTSEINSIIVAFLTTHKKKTEIPIAKIDQEYREETGERIPFAKLGYPSLPEYLKTVPGIEIVQLYNNNYVNFSGSENSKHIAELTSGQRSKTFKSNNRYSGYTKSLNSYSSRYRGPSAKVDKYILDYISSIMKRYSQGLSKHELSEKLKYEYGINDKMINLNEYLRALSKELMVKDKIVYRISSSKLDDSKSSGSSYYEQSNVAKVNNFGNNYQAKFEYYSAHDDSITEDLDFNGPIDIEFDPSYEVKAVDCSDQTEINKKQQPLEYQNINTFQCEENTNNFSNSSEQREKILSQNKDHLINTLNKRVQFRLEKLIQSHPEGIWSTEFPKLYEDEYKISLEWANFGFHRFSDFAAHLTDIFHVVGPQLNGDFKLYNAKEPLPDEKPQETPKKLTNASLYEVYSEYDTDPVPTSVPASFSQRLCPDDVITVQETVGQISVTDFGMNGSIENKPLVEVEISEVFSPSFFWIRSLKAKSKFQKMMSKLQEFYERSYEQYSVPIIMLERGLNIACVFQEKWHRGIIKRVDHDCKVSVMFYDYGTLEKYPPEQIFYLHRSFTALPAQAIPCGLYGIAPLKGDLWPRKVRDRFNQWALERCLWAGIVEVDIERNSMLVTLADTSESEDFYINDWLLEKGLAVNRKMVCIRPKNFLYERYLQCQAMKKILKAEVICNKNTRLTPKNHQSLSSESPLSRRLRLLEKLRNISQQVESDKPKKKMNTCPTCGSCLPIVDDNSKTFFDKVSSWLNRHNLNNIALLEKSDKNFANISQSFNHRENNSLVKDRIQEKQLKSIKGSVLVSDRIREKKLKIIESNRLNNDIQPREFMYDHSNSPCPLEVSEELLDDTVPESVAGWHKVEIDINWDDIKTAPDRRKIKNHINTELDERKKKCERAVIPVQQSQVLEKMNKSYKNFIQEYYSSAAENEDVFKWKSEHKIVKSEIITPMVIKTLNSINKNLDPIKISVPEDVKKILENDAEDFSSIPSVSPEHDKSNGYQSEDQWNFPHKQGHLNFEHENENQAEQGNKNEKLNNSDISNIEITNDNNNNNNNDNNNDCDELIDNKKIWNSICHATFNKNILERLNTFKTFLKSDTSSENSNLDSDDSDENIKLSTSNNQNYEDDLDNESEEENIKEFESADKHEYNSTEASSLKKKINDPISPNEPEESQLITENFTPVFNDESISDESEMDFNFDDDFMNHLMCIQKSNMANNRLSIEEVDSDDQDALGLSEK